MPCLKRKGEPTSPTEKEEGRGVPEEEPEQVARGRSRAMHLFCGLLATLAERMACGKYKRKRQVRQHCVHLVCGGGWLNE
ncbi:hypothetical protein E2C01_039910 [Portunus trituberculatus]|uniref:Uncharacterized protein n=1 Tax=Portunus trituberculatus TaxID=210409 RepID=A0A5B7FMI4_PORTR|nr:hypothetical protein [Portunus trituberculatus]